MRKSLALALAPLALLVASCGGAEQAPVATPSESQARAVEQVPGKGDISSRGVDFTTVTAHDLKLTTDMEYEFISSAETLGTIRLVDSSDKRVAKIEKYLKDNTGYHREYMIAEVDNRRGTEAANMYQVDIFDPEGASYTFTKARDLISDAIPTMHSDYSYTTADGSKKLTGAEYERIRDAGHELEEAQAWDVSPLGKETFILAMEIDEGALPKVITGMSVMAHGGFDEVSAYSPFVSEYKEWEAFQEAGKEWEAVRPEPVASLGTE